MRSSRFGPRRPVTVRVLPAVMLAIGGLLAAAGSASACKTPVYRFAMYNWDRTPYVVYYLHRGEISEADAQLNEGIRTLAKAVPAATNLELFTIDIASAEPLEGVPEALRDEAAYVVKAHQDAKAPRYVVYSPLSSEVFAGELNAEDVQLLAGSPGRRKMTSMLAGGNAAVMILVLGDDAQANAKAEQECRKVIKAASEGLITAGDTDIPGLIDLNPSLDGEQTKDEDANKIEVGLVKISRDDPKERWLLRCLMQVEDELAERTEAMVFTVYGRGRANLPNIGLGIKEDLLTRQIRFVLGPCSCQVKRGNPGMDLMTTADWKSAAQAMAEEFGTETGNEHLLGEAEFPNIFSEIIDPPSEDAGDTAKLDDADNVVDNDAAGGDAKLAVSTLSHPSDAKSGLANAPIKAVKADGEGGLHNLGYGVAGAVILMALATLLLMRPRG